MKLNLLFKVMIDIMKKFSRKKVVTISAVVLLCVMLGLAVVIMLHGDKPVYTPKADIHEFASGNNVIEFKFGPDVTGKVYNVKLYASETEEGLGQTHISIDGGEKQQVSDDNGNSAYLVNAVSVIDDNGKAIIALNMDYMSDDYFFVMYTVEDGKLVYRGTENGALIAEAHTDRTFTADCTVNFFGTWICTKTFELTKGNKIQSSDVEYVIPDNRKISITPKTDVMVEISDKDGYYSSYKLEKGHTIIPYATDGEKYVLFTDENGVKGRINGEIKEGLTVIGGDKTDVDLFDGIQYVG